MIPACFYLFFFFHDNADAAIAVRFIFPRHISRELNSLELHPVSISDDDVKRDRDRIEFQSDMDCEGEKKG